MLYHPPQNDATSERKLGQGTNPPADNLLTRHEQRAQHDGLEAVQRLACVVEGLGAQTHGQHCLHCGTCKARGLGRARQLQGQVQLPARMGSTACTAEVAMVHDFVLELT